MSLFAETKDLLSGLGLLLLEMVDLEIDVFFVDKTTNGAATMIRLLVELSEERGEGWRGCERFELGLLLEVVRDDGGLLQKRLVNRVQGTKNGAFSWRFCQEQRFDRRLRGRRRFLDGNSFGNPVFFLSHVTITNNYSQYPSIYGKHRNIL